MSAAVITTTTMIDQPLRHAAHRFRPVELYTKYGRRGRINEPVGTHGAMKCLFDGPVQQRDAVCMSLYKRAFPKWPADLTFA